jgi:hypothetical protein
METLSLTLAIILIYYLKEVYSEELDSSRHQPCSQMLVSKPEAKFIKAASLNNIYGIAYYVLRLFTRLKFFIRLAITDLKLSDLGCDGQTRREAPQEGISRHRRNGTFN